MKNIDKECLEGKNKSMVLAKIFRSNYRLINIDGKIRYYDPKSGCYRVLTKDICAHLTYKLLKHGTKYQFGVPDIKNVYEILCMDSISSKKWNAPEPYLLNCKNCVWDVRKDKFYKHSPKFGFTYVLNVRCNTKKGFR